MDVNKKIISDFIEEIWNQNRFENIDKYLDQEFKDFSLPPFLPPNKHGLIQWIESTGKSFEHKTIIEEMVGEDNKVILKIRMLMKQIGKWRDIEPSGAEVYAIGYRYFKFSDKKIIQHWALIDGNAIENQLRESTHGCKIQN